MTIIHGDIDPKVAKHAEMMECYCGRPLIIAHASACEGCAKTPEECKCEELPDDSRDER
jgi:hypothetical protein